MLSLRKLNRNLAYGDLEVTDSSREELNCGKTGMKDMRTGLTELFSKPLFVHKSHEPTVLRHFSTRKFLNVPEPTLLGRKFAFFVPLFFWWEGRLVEHQAKRVLGCPIQEGARIYPRSSWLIEPAVLQANRIGLGQECGSGKGLFVHQGVAISGLLQKRVDSCRECKFDIERAYGRALATILIAEFDGILKRLGTLNFPIKFRGDEDRYLSSSA